MAVSKKDISSYSIRKQNCLSYSKMEIKIHKLQSRTYLYAIFLDMLNIQEKISKKNNRKDDICMPAILPREAIKASR